MYLLQGSDFGTTLLYKQGDIFTENILFYIYFTLLKITISTGMNSFLLIQRGAGPQCRRVAQAKDKAGIVCGSVGGHLPAAPRGKLGVQVGNPGFGADLAGLNSGSPADELWDTRQSTLPFSPLVSSSVSWGQIKIMPTRGLCAK